MPNFTPLPRPLNERPLSDGVRHAVRIDVETTGTDHLKDEIIEFGMLRVAYGRWTSTDSPWIEPHRRQETETSRAATIALRAMHVGRSIVLRGGK